MTEVYFNLYFEQNKIKKKAVLKDQLLHVHGNFPVTFSTWCKVLWVKLIKNILIQFCHSL